MNRLCEMFGPTSHQECAPDDVGPYRQSPAPERRRDLRKHPSFAVLPETTRRGVVMVVAGGVVSCSQQQTLSAEHICSAANLCPAGYQLLPVWSGSREGCVLRAGRVWVDRCL